jgi:hypothetical protein
MQNERLMAKMISNTVAEFAVLLVVLLPHFL